MNSILSFSAVPESEIDALSQLRQSLPEKSELGMALEKMSEGLRSGAEITVARDNDEVTPSRAASILGISRTHLYKILDAGLIPSRIVGARDRRIYMVDVQEYLTQTMKLRAGDAVSIAKREQYEDNILDSME